MIHIQLDVYSHHIRISGFNQEGNRVIRDYLKARLTQYGMVPVGYGRMERRPLRVFAAGRSDRSEYRIHANLLDDFVGYIHQAYPTTNDIKINYHSVPKGVHCVFDDRGLHKPRPDQIPVIDFLCYEGKKTRALVVQTGFGKSLCLMLSTVRLQTRIVLILRGMYVERWMKDLKGMMRLKPGELLLIRGSKDLKNLILMAKTGELKAKVIVITNRTMLFYLDAYETYNGDHGLYGCEPQDFYETIGAGVRAIDEVHQDYHLNLRLDCYTNIERTISLSATLHSDNRFIDRMYDIGYPERNRYRTVYNKYIHAKALMYRFNDPSEIRFLSRMRMYSHVAFEKSIMKKKSLLNNYTQMINNVIYTSYITKRKPGQKILIYCATIKYCTYLFENLKRAYPDLKVGRYVEEDKYDDLLNNDICVSTLISAGTAVDIPGLRIVLMTTALGSMQANEQALGRLRPLHQWPEDTCEFLYLVCEDITAHINYYERKQKNFEGKVKAHQMFYLDKKV